MPEPKDHNGNAVAVGDRVRLLTLSGDWFDKLPEDEKTNVESMIGEVFAVEEIDEYGHPWIYKDFPESEDRVRSHSIAVEPNEIEIVFKSAAG